MAETGTHSQPVTHRFTIAWRHSVTAASVSSQYPSARADQNGAVQQHNAMASDDDGAE
jgi:hypothetical protein